MLVNDAKFVSYKVGENFLINMKFKLYSNEKKDFFKNFLVLRFIFK